jgi:Na+/H+-dicarboxylate symporter
MNKSQPPLQLWKKVLIGLIAGLVVGLGLHYGLGPEPAQTFADSWLRPFGDAFVRLIQMLIVPLITATLVAGVTAMGDPQRLGSLGFRTLALYFITTLVAVSLGLLIGTLLQPGKGVDYGTANQAAVQDIEGKIATAEAAGTFSQRMLQIIPSNPLQALASTDVLAIIFFSILLGIGILLAGEGGKPLAAFFDAASEVMMRLTLLVMELAPYGVFALISWVMASRGIGILSNLLWLMLALYLACILQIVLVYGLVIIKGMLGLPMKAFFRGVLDAQGVAFSTSSSSATLPVTITCAEVHLGLNKSIAGSVLPLGATINMDGTSIYLGLVALFAAQAAGIELSWMVYLSVALTATLVSIGAAGIPSAGLLLAATVLKVVGIDQAEALLIIAFIFPFDRLLDMMRTMTNITGDLAVACAVGKWEGMLDEEAFRADTKTG